MTAQGELFDHAREAKKAAAVSDICAGRHGGNPNSQAANLKASERKAYWQKMVHQAVTAAGARGLTLKEFCADHDLHLNQVSGRFSELKKAGKIYQSGRRSGCGVWYMFSY